VEFTKVVVLELPLKLTTELGMKLVPFTVRVNAASPAFLVAGVMLVVVGTGLFTFTTGEVPIIVSVPPFCLVWVVKVFPPVVEGAVTGLYVAVKPVPPGQVMLIAIVHGPVPVPVIALREAAVQLVFATTTLLLVGAVQLAGTTMVA